MRPSIGTLAGTAAVTALAFAVAAGWADEARACGGRGPAALSALPARGSTEVSPHTSIVVISGEPSAPNGLQLEADGQLAPLPPLELLGEGAPGSGSQARYWRLRGSLQPSTTYVLRAMPRDGSSVVELTRFTTAATSDKTPGTAPRPERLRLWRVRYPLEQVGRGSCVFDEYEGYIDLDYQPGMLPGTPAGEIVHVLTLRPRTGSGVQSFVFSGLGRFEGARVEAPGGQGVTDVPEGGRPSPALALWKPTLDPDREYCATLTLHGRNDLAIEPVASEPICARVTSLGGAGGGCNVAAHRPGWGIASLIPLLLLLLLVSSRGDRWRTRVVRQPLPAGDGGQE